MIYISTVVDCRTAKLSDFLIGGPDFGIFIRLDHVNARTVTSHPVLHFGSS